jgi:hypothetical protein
MALSRLTRHQHLTQDRKQHRTRAIALRRLTSIADSSPRIHGSGVRGLDAAKPFNSPLSMHTGTRMPRLLLKEQRNAFGPDAAALQW